MVYFCIGLLNFYGELGTKCCLFYKFVLETVLMKDCLDIIRDYQEYHMFISFEIE